MTNILITIGVLILVVSILVILPFVLLAGISIAFVLGTYLLVKDYRESNKE